MKYPNNNDNNIKMEGLSMESIIRDMEKEKILDNSSRLNQWTSNLFNKQNRNKKEFNKEIKKASDENYDELHLRFHNKYPNLNIDEINLVKSVFDFVKEN